MNTPLTPLDGRYYQKIESLIPYLSENAFIKYRVYIEAEWLIFLLVTIGKPLEADQIAFLRDLAKNFSADDADAVRLIEKEVNHDTKAVELWLVNMLAELGSNDLAPFVHFGRTSEDINNLAYACMIRDLRKDVIVPSIDNIATVLEKQVANWSTIPMLARTHGQPATPTTVGKEVAVFLSRVRYQSTNINAVQIRAKCNGATGTFAADALAYPSVDWPTEMQKFVEAFGFEFSLLTTQIESHDWLARLCNEVALLGTIMIDLSRDYWQYISLGYFKQKVIEGEVGSSTMPHKVNPIDFENAEANFGIANALFRHMSEKLPISRLQRDLSDSSVLRSLSEAFGHWIVATSALQKGLSKVACNQEVIQNDLRNQWGVLTEAVQTILRKNGVSDAYVLTKQMSRGKEITETELHDFVRSLSLPLEDEQLLLNLRPETYIGIAAKIVDL